MSATTPATPFKVAVLVSLRLVSWLEEHGLEPLMQGWSQEQKKPWVVIKYSRRLCDKLKQRHVAEIIQRRRHEGSGIEEHRYQIEVHGCIVQWTEGVAT